MSNPKRRQTVVVTGASAGVGRAVVREFAKQGAQIGLLSRGTDGLEGARADVEHRGGKALVLPVDVADAARVESAASQIEEHFGPIDIWINNAMVSVFSPFIEISPDEYKRVTEVTYLGCVYGTMAALRRMKPRNQGTILQVGSALAYRAIPLQSAYCGAKHAIQGFTESIQSELIHDGSKVRLTMVQLPAVNTPQFSWVKSRLYGKPQPVPPIYQPEVVARAIVWAAQNAPRELHVGIATVIAIEGNKFFPKFGDWYLGKTGYDSQQTKEPDDPSRPNNLWEPVPGDHGAHGSFDSRAHCFSLQSWFVTKGRAAGLLGGLGLATAVAFGLHKGRKRCR